MDFEHDSLQPNYFEQTPPCPPPAKPAAALRRPASRRDLGFGIILAVLIVLAADFYLWGRAGLAASVATGLIFLVGAGYMLKYRKKLTLYGIYCGLAYLAGAASLVFSNGGFIKFLLAVCLMVLGTVAIMELLQLRTYKDSSYRTLGDFFYAAFALTFGSIGRCIYALFHKEGAEGKSEGRKVGVVLMGIACAIPLLLIIVPLLVSSDAAFSGLLERLALDNLGELFGALLLGLSAFILLFGRLFSAPYIHRETEETHGTGGIAPMAICSCLGVIALVYLLYLVSQLAYFFSAFSGLLPENYSEAEYARRGFFEMCAICALNLLIIFLATLVCKKDKPYAPLSIRLLSLFFCIFSLILIATAFSKMSLYIDSFGMTRLRIFTSVFMVFLAVVFLAVALRLFIPKIPYVKIAVAAASLLLVATCFANVDSIVARYNVTAYKTDKLDSIDMDTLWALDRDSAAPWLIVLLDDDDPEVAAEAGNMLYSAVRDHFYVSRDYGNITSWDYENQPIDWRAYNLPYARAHKLLWENKNQIIRVYFDN